MDLANVKLKHGTSICLLGNVDSKHVLPYGSEEDVRRDVRRCIDAAAGGGGLVLTSGNSIHSGVSWVDEARRYGKYPLRHR